MIGEILDEKYEIEKELGRGGMGIVYLATHVGTGRFVAVKVILPEFVRNPEFIERFRREARAAGRLRHPNVVDVTDFGIAKTSIGNVAYLVMEYLDGCTLAEVLEEEKKLPLSWTVDILEQVCSAVHQAHQQGVIHRDLKPENIWLEPNKRGGYNVKVLDFGIAKLEENTKEEIEESFEMSDVAVDATNPVMTEKTAILSKKETSATDVDFSEKDTALFSSFETKQKAKKSGTSDLTRAGAVLGTPLYMSPEQCRGEKLDARSDVYSLGVIAYRMLSGKMPFDGNFAEVIKAHQEKQPPPLEGKGIPRAVKEVIDSALAKKPEDRPQTAQAFSDKLRTASEGIGELLRKSLIIYSEQFPRLIFISFLALFPGFLIHTLKMAFGVLTFLSLMKPLIIPIGFIDVILQQVSWAMLSGMTTLMVAHHLILPLRPMNLSSFFSLVMSRIKPLFLTVFTVSVLWWIGIIFCLVPGFIVSVLLLLAPSIVVIEKVNVRQALKRSVELVKRSYRTAVAVVLFSTVIPMFFSVFLGIFSNAVVKAYMSAEKAQSSQIKNERTDTMPEDDALQMNVAEYRKSKEALLRETIVNSIFQMSFTLILVFLVPFLTVLTVLFYFKMRFAGGESLQDLTILFEELEIQKPEWQKRIQARQLSLDRTKT
jgi:serine/threonine protein kinase